MNKWEEACKTFLRGCINVKDNHQEDCEECLEDFCKHIRKLAKEENYDEANEFCINWDLKEYEC